MSTLIGILSFIAVLAGCGAAYRVWEKRSTRQKSEPLAPETRQAPGLVVPPQPQPTPAPTIAPTDNLPGPSMEDIQKVPESSLEATSESLPVPQPQPEVEPDQPPTEAIAEPTAASGAAVAEPTTLEPGVDAEMPVDAAEGVLDAPPAETAAPLATVTPVSPAELSNAATVGSDYLSEKIALAGRSRQLHQAPYLFRYANHADGNVRAAVATALGNIAANKRGPAVDTIVTILGKLSQDSKSPVRLQAVEALGKIRSNSVLPWLQRAQQRSDAAVSQSAATAIQRLKFIQQPKKPVAQKPLPRKVE